MASGIAALRLGSLTEKHSFSANRATKPQMPCPPNYLAEQAGISIPFSYGLRNELPASLSVPQIPMRRKCSSCDLVGFESDLVCKRCGSAMAADLGPKPATESRVEPRRAKSTGLLKFFGIAFLAHVVFLFGYVYLANNFFGPGDLPLDSIVIPYYLWPLFVLPSGGGGSHGGELFFAVFSIPINSLIWALILSTFKRIGSAPQPS